MNKTAMAILAGVLCAVPAWAQGTAAQEAKPAKLAPPAAVKDQAGYAIGLQIGRTLKSDQLEVSLKYLMQGVVDALRGNKQLLDDRSCAQALDSVRREARSRVETAMGKKAATNQAEGQKFLAANRSRPGVVTLPSGLQYKVLKVGKGASPKATDRVKTHYHGTLLDGTVFDSSVQRNEPAEFGVNQVIRGWTEALQKMKPGDKWVLYIPPELAYGARGAGGVIGPNQTLVFEVELLEVNPK